MTERKEGKNSHDERKEVENKYTWGEGTVTAFGRTFLFVSLLLPRLAYRSDSSSLFDEHQPIRISLKDTAKPFLVWEVGHTMGFLFLRSPIQD